MKNEVRTLYFVAYWFYCDTDTMTIMSFETPEEASTFEDVIWDKCQEQHIECDVVVYTGQVMRYNDAIDALNKQLQDEE